MPTSGQSVFFGESLSCLVTSRHILPIHNLPYIFEILRTHVLVLQTTREGIPVSAPATHLFYVSSMIVLYLEEAS